MGPGDLLAVAVAPVGGAEGLVNARVEVLDRRAGVRRLGESDMRADHGREFIVPRLRRALYLADPVAERGPSIDSIFADNWSILGWSLPRWA